MANVLCDTAQCNSVEPSRGVRGDESQVFGRMDRRTILAGGAGALAAAVWAARGTHAQDAEIPPPENISLETRDRVVIRCTYYPGTNGKKTIPIIMIHDYLGRRTEYDALARALQRVRGHAIIVPDLRGHGESTRRRGFDGNDQEVSAENFKPADFAEMVTQDLEKVKGYLVKRNNDGELNIEQLCVIGAGPMGSVVALNWIARDWAAPSLPTLKQGQDVKAMVLLSPAKDYKTLKTAPILNHPYIGAKMSTMLIGGAKETDIKSIYTQLKRKHVATPVDNDERIKHQDLFYLLEETDLRGTRLLSRELDVAKNILQFIDWRLVNKAEDYEWAERKNPLDK